MKSFPLSTISIGSDEETWQALLSELYQESSLGSPSDSDFLKPSTMSDSQAWSTENVGKQAVDLEGVSTLSFLALPKPSLTQDHVVAAATAGEEDDEDGDGTHSPGDSRKEYGNGTSMSMSVSTPATTSKARLQRSANASCTNYTSEASTQQFSASGASEYGGLSESLILMEKSSKVYADPSVGAGLTSPSRLTPEMKPARHSPETPMRMGANPEWGPFASFAYQPAQHERSGASTCHVHVGTTPQTSTSQPLLRSAPMPLYNNNSNNSTMYRVVPVSSPAPQQFVQQGTFAATAMDGYLLQQGQCIVNRNSLQSISPSRSPQVSGGGVGVAPWEAPEHMGAMILMDAQGNMRVVPHCTIQPQNSSPFYITSPTQLFPPPPPPPPQAAAPVPTTVRVGLPSTPMAAKQTHSFSHPRAQCGAFPSTCKPIYDFDTLPISLPLRTSDSSATLVSDGATVSEQPKTTAKAWMSVGSQWVPLSL